MYSKTQAYCTDHFSARVITENFPPTRISRIVVCGPETKADPGLGGGGGGGGGGIRGEGSKLVDGGGSYSPKLLTRGGGGTAYRTMAIFKSHMYA